MGFGFAEVLAKALVFDQEDAAPEQVNEPVLAAEVADGFLETGDVPAGQAEDVKEGIPKGLALGRFAGLARPIVGKTNGVVSDFIPGNRHGRRLARTGGKGEKNREEARAWVAAFGLDSPWITPV